jgi:imidazolonepropionase-like amidohydrolase
LLLGLAGFGLPGHAQTVAIKAGRIVTMNGPVLSNGVILIRNGKIAAVGNNIAIPAGTKIIDASGKVVMPGLVAALTHLGDRSDSDVAVTPDARAIESFDFYGDYKRLLEGGITSGYIGAGERRLVSGQGAVVKLAGANQAARTVRSSSDVRITLGDLSKAPPALFRPPIPPTTENPILPAQRQILSVRPSEFAVLRQLFADARTQSAWVGAQTARSQAVPVKIASTGKPPVMPRRAVKLMLNTKFSALVPIIRGERPLRITAHKAGDILKALAFADEEHVKIVLEGATEGYKVAGEIARRNVPVVVESTARIGRAMPEDLTRLSANGHASLGNAAALSRAGVRVSLAPQDDAELPDLLMLAAYQVQYGVSRDTALRMVSANSAETLGVANRLGSLSVGKDADILVLSGDPLDSHTHVEMTLVDGSVVFKRPSAIPSGDAVAIRAGRLLTVTQGEIQNAVIIVRGGKIESVSRDGIVPSDMRVIDASHSVVMPGMIDAYSHLGLHADAEPAPLNPPAATTGSATGRTKLLNALEPNDPAFAEALHSGVTTVLIAPPTSGQVCGQALLTKTTPSGDRVVKELAAVCFNFQGGAPRMSQIWNFREMLQRAKDYTQRRAAYEQVHRDWVRDSKEAEAAHKTAPTEPTEVQKDEDQEMFAALFRKDVPALVHAGRADEIDNALKVFCDETDLNMVLVDPTDGYRVTDSIRKRNVPAALGPSFVKREKGVLINNADALSHAGIPVIFQSSATSGTQLLRMNAAYAVRNGMDPGEAIRALTINPARALNVQNRLGSIEPGKDADLVILSGDPFNMTSRVEKVIVNGKEAYRGR